MSFQIIIENLMVGTVVNSKSSLRMIAKAIKDTKKRTPMIKCIALSIVYVPIVKLTLYISLEIIFQRVKNQIAGIKTFT